MMYEMKKNFSVLSVENKADVKKTLLQPMKRTHFLFKKLWRWSVIILIPLVLAIIFGRNFTLISRGAFILFLMSAYWITNCIPMYVTAMIPIVLGPAFGIVTSKEICQSYMKDTIMLFLGGLIIAMAIEKSNLHRRISLLIIKNFGIGQRSLLLGFMLPTWFLSMWINNTATTAMMIAIINSVLNNLEELEKTSQTKFTIGELENEELATLKPVVKRKTASLENFGKAISLSIAYSASCGGIATLTGTAPNSILKGIISVRYGNIETLSFASWMGFALPISFLLLIFTWIWLMIRFFGIRQTFSLKNEEPSESSQPIKQIIVEEYNKLGKITYQEIVCLTLFLACSVLWMTRKPGQPGWSTFFRTDVKYGREIEYVGDSQPAILVSILLMILPAKNPIEGMKELYQHMKRKDSELESFNALDQIPEHIAAEKRPDIFLLPWRTVEKKFPWGIVFILGGGFALSECCIKSELSGYMGDMLSGMAGLKPSLLVIFVTLSSAMITEVTSNAATASILIPVALDLCHRAQIHPFLIAFPLTISTSFSFCLPVSTPPNALVFSNGRLKISDMITTGLVLNIVGAAIVTLGTLTWGKKMFHLDTFPSWA